MSDPDSSDSPQAKLIHEWSRAFKKRDLNPVMETLHKDYRHATYPRSIGRPEQTREEWLKHITEYMSLWTEFEMTIHSITGAAGKVILHATIDVKTSVGVDTTRESILIMHMVTDEDGSLKIMQVEDFTDSKAYLDFIHAIAAAKAKK